MYFFKLKKLKGEIFMARIRIDEKKVVGKIKPMHAVGQPPFTGGFATLDFTPFQVLKDARIPYSRLHDVGGPFGSNRYVDIPNIFRDFTADECDPRSYDFTFTDELLKALKEYGVEPYFRLGVTIENQCQIKAYHINPPKDYGKWARICEHIVRHYNEGWADGFHFGIRYWEIWNEPENHVDPALNQMWTGTREEYYRLYDVCAKHLKKCFGDKIKVGGYGASGLYGLLENPEKYGLNIKKREGKPQNREKNEYRINFLYGFLEYLNKNGTPIDFFSWHAYGNVEFITAEADFIDATLKKYGYVGLETHLNEWNLSHNRKINIGTSYASANVMATMIAMQQKTTDMLMYYDAKYVSTSAYAGFYDVATFEPSCIYYDFLAFGELYALKNQIECTSSEEGIYTIGAADGEKTAIIIANTGADEKIETDLPSDFAVYLINKENLMVKTELCPKSFTLAENTAALIKNFN